jgi:hypothetical protein
MDTHWIVHGGTGAGYWDDGNHWSNGFPNDNVNAVFDSSSFNNTGQSVIVRYSTSCKNLDFSAAINNPHLTIGLSSGLLGDLGGGVILTVKGDVTLATGMTTTGTDTLQFSGTTNLKPNGVVFPYVLQVIAGELILAGILITTSDINFISGTISTNNFSWQIQNFVSSNTNTRALVLGSSILNCASWNYSGTNMTLNAGTSTINLNQ